MIPQKSNKQKKSTSACPTNCVLLNAWFFKAYCAIIFNFSIFLIMASLCTDLANISALLMCKWLGSQKSVCYGKQIQESFLQGIPSFSLKSHIYSLKNCLSQRWKMVGSLENIQNKVFVLEKQIYLLLGLELVIYQLWMLTLNIIWRQSNLKTC